MLIGNFLSLFVGRTLVTDRLVQTSVGTLKGVLKEKGFADVDKIPEHVAMAVVQEALRNAAEKETDHRPRTKEFYFQIERAADAIIAAFEGDESANSRIRGILEFHSLLKEPNQLPDPTSPSVTPAARAASAPSVAADH